jgi:hypothetical protein
MERRGIGCLPSNTIAHAAGQGTAAGFSKRPTMTTWLATPWRRNDWHACARWGYKLYREMFNDRQLLGLEVAARLITEQKNERVRDALATNLSDLLRYQRASVSGLYDAHSSAAVAYAFADL